MPRVAKPKQPSIPEQTLVVDNGGSTIKAGFVTESVSFDDCEIIPNCLARDRGRQIWIGAQLDKCHDFGEIAFRRPVEKGFVVNWESEKAIWDSTFIDDGAKLKCDPQSTNLILTEAPSTPLALQSNTDQIVFEEYEFASYSRWTAPSLNAYNEVSTIFDDPANTTEQQAATPAECVLVIDSGFSQTTVTPLFRGRPIQQAVRRLDVGGKFLTNYLKEMVSIRHYNLLDETHLMNEVKEAVCFVSTDLRRDLERTWNDASTSQRALREGEQELFIDYVLPDYNVPRKGYVRPHDPSASAKLRKLGSAAPAVDHPEDYMTLGNERFTVPELLFRPDDIGLKQPGIPRMVFESLSGVPTGLWPSMLANVLVVGGSSLMDGFMTRLDTEIRQLAPSECVVRVKRAPDPIKSTWLGGAHLASNRSLLSTLQVTRAEYLEYGSSWLTKVFSQRSKKER